MQNHLPALFRVSPDGVAGSETHQQAIPAQLAPRHIFNLINHDVAPR